eukprot:gene17974-biopygen5382
MGLVGGCAPEACTGSWVPIGWLAAVYRKPVPEAGSEWTGWLPYTEYLYRKAALADSACKGKNRFHPWWKSRASGYSVQLVFWLPSQKMCRGHRNPVRTAYHAMASWWPGSRKGYLASWRTRQGTKRTGVGCSPGTGVRRHSIFHRAC